MFGARHIFKVWTGARYLGDYIRDNDPKQDWLREHTLTWENKISTIRKIAGQYSQESYAEVVHAIQSEWIFLQYATWDMGDTFTVAEEIIRETFLPRLFFRKEKTLSPIVGDISTMPVKKSGLVLLNTLTS